MIYEILIDGRKFHLDLRREVKDSERWRCQLNGHELHVNGVLARPNILSILIDGKAFEVKRERIGSDLHLWVGSERYAAVLRDPRSFRSRRQTTDSLGGAKSLLAPMPGKVVRVLLNERDTVESGQGIVVVEAMKMQNEIKSPKRGIVRKLAVTQGDAVNAGDVLAIVE